MMKPSLTREQRKRSKRLMAACAAAIAACALCVALSVTVNAAFDGEKYQTTLSVIGACWVSATFMRVVCWLDTPRKEGKRR